MKKILLLAAVLISSASMLSASSNAITNGEKVRTTNIDGLSLVKVNALNEPQTIGAKAMKASANKIAKTNAISVLNVTPKAEPLDAFYDRPDGFYFWGVSPNWQSYSMPVLQGHAYSPATWANLSSGATSYTWTYDDPNGVGDAPARLTSTDKELNVTYPYSFWVLPELVASDGTNNSTYTMNTPGDDGKAIYGMFGTGGPATDGKIDFGVSSQDFSAGMTAYYATEIGNWWFGTGPAAKENGIIGMATYMEKPTHSYLLSSIYVLVSNFVAEPDAELAVTVTKINDDGTFGDVIATGKCLGSDFISFQPDKNGGFAGTLPFTLTQKDPITGLIEDVTPTINSGIIVSLSGYQDNPKLTSMTMRVSTNEPRTNLETGYFLMEDKEGTFYYPVSKLFENPIYTAPSIFMNIEYTWFETEGDTFNAAVTGESKTFDVNTYYYSAAWSTNEDLPEWIEVTATDDKEAISSTLTFTVDPLPTGTTGRQADVTVSIPGTDKVFHITQGVVGVEGVKVSAVKVATVGGDFAVSYPATVNSVKIYNVAGQLVETVSFAELGNTIIPAQNLAKGMYILKFNDNTTVKAIK